MNQHELIVKELQTGYGEKTVINELSLMIPSNKISVIIGANGCGKSTLLKSLSRLLKPKHGAILLDDKSVNNYSLKDIARRVSKNVSRNDKRGLSSSRRGIRTYGNFRFGRCFRG